MRSRVAASGSLALLVLVLVGVVVNLRMLRHSLHHPIAASLHHEAQTGRAALSGGGRGLDSANSTSARISFSTRASMAAFSFAVMSFSRFRYFSKRRMGSFFRQPSKTSFGT